MKIKEWIAFIIMSLLVILAIFGRFSHESDLRKNGILVHVTVDAVLPPSKGGGPFALMCHFMYHGEQKTLNSFTHQRDHLGKYLYKESPALYSPKTDNLRLLLTRSDFEEYGVPFTDSLRDVIIQLNGYHEEVEKDSVSEALPGSKHAG